MKRNLVSGAKERTGQTHQSGQIRGRDLQFLPAALEILETPTPPVATTFMMTICAFAAAAILWSFIGHLDVDAVAPGKIEALGHAKVVEAIDPGKLAFIHVEPGSNVHSGDLLVEFDPAESRAELDAAQSELYAAQAEIVRRRFAIGQVQGLAVKLQADSDQTAPAAALVPIIQTSADVGWTAPIPSETRQREQAVLQADFAVLASTLESLDKQSMGRHASLTRLHMSIAHENDLIETLSQAAAMRQESVVREVDSKINLYDAQAELEKSQSQLASDTGQLAEGQAALDETSSDKRKAVEQFLADYAGKLADAEKHGDDEAQAVNKAEAQLAHTRLTAPVDGIVQDLAATTIGQVFTTGQQIMTIAPAKPSLQVEALVPNTDIGFLKLGQGAVIKVDAFPFTRFGTVRGHIVRIAAGAVEEQEAKRQLADAVAAANEATSSAGVSPGSAPSFVFPITIALDQNSIAVDGADIPLASGMSVVAEVRTGERRIIDYLVSPLSKISSEAFKER
ncbi:MULTISPECIES: HlyD family type I secretion periplasmic adaptor subunit [unclassified Mesorhizobium]|uniref:HlyD family type I secretion periplasmic adaptor subunit n=1 Tax=unclassified Mesorhizobium TaxID=325217 RepID=UPI00112D97F0|nr:MULTISPECIES: HlyD family type I secretion periplasmic adaptor subunit [unclassified Mesorhizobium]MBZ9739935.1 HlyD family type I secretion periplasmic adaptor subunit [Mesorhizobium sp. CO1-1-4]MBZ9805748.1 HlyD family type I secretion periplasmic adaptor subunit [Mesorhizobium sp. ES1-6]TPL88565.1 HlyD family type I secretion periplasmic adaptor subunit [Mesorhizobium sp. B2-3-12]